MQPSTFAELLGGGDRRYRGSADVAIAAVMRDPGRFEELFELLFSEDETAAARAAYAVESITRSRPDFLVPLRKRLFEAAERETWEVRRCVATLLPRVKLDAKDRSRALKLLVEFFDNERPLVAAAAMTSLADYAVEDRAVLVKVQPKIEAVAAGGDKTAALRANKVLAFLKRRTAPATPGPAKAESPAKPRGRFSR